ncbi:hypothetical protein MTR_8g010720 [Medicago truncatula]|uniref:Uncharacterized protein n=1 Tax=Medicago truncatula TaxID=3880 RepID=G7ZVU0_MEDTR|nr:hypothetical protein MTR_8g010720 [Medicago truncatula]
MEPNRATIWQTLQPGYDFNEAIVLRFTASEYDFGVSENIPIKGNLFSEPRVRNFGERNRLLEQEIWREGGRPSKLISEIRAKDGTYAVNCVLMFLESLGKLTYIDKFHEYGLTFKKHYEEGKLPNYVVIEQRFFDLLSKTKKHKLLPIYHTFSWLDEMMNQNKNNTNETSMDYIFVRYIEEFTSNIYRWIQIIMLPCVSFASLSYSRAL